MTSNITSTPRLLFQRAKVRKGDERVFFSKLAVLTLLLAVGSFAAMNSSFLLSCIGMVVLALAYTHAVELQHQCLHHSAFRKSGVHRWVGVPLGMPLLVGYSHYRVRHLQHHRYLGTPDDTEFFGFDTRQPVTVKALMRGMFDLARLWAAVRDTGLSVVGAWRYEFGQISPKSSRDIMNEYRIFAACFGGLGVLCVFGEWRAVLCLWVVPFILAMPMHFLVELPEHILCDTASIDVLRNTRSITGSRFTTWFTNGNNLHIEHHAAMNVPINRLPERHGEVRVFGLNVQRTYMEFYRIVLGEIRKNAKSATWNNRRLIR